jgi:hypothetical protein
MDEGGLWFSVANMGPENGYASAEGMQLQAAAPN